MRGGVDGRHLEDGGELYCCKSGLHGFCKRELVPGMGHGADICKVGRQSGEIPVGWGWWSKSRWPPFPRARDAASAAAEAGNFAALEGARVCVCVCLERHACTRTLLLLLSL